MIGTWRITFRELDGSTLLDTDGVPVSSVLARGGSRRMAAGVARGAVAVRCGVSSPHIRRVDVEAVDDEARMIDASDGVVPTSVASGSAEQHVDS
jgi:hypothetical protein